MTRFHFLPVLILAAFISVSCADDCTKTITHPGYTVYTPGGAVSYPEQNQEIPCNDPVPETGELGQNVNYLSDFNWEVLSFNFTPDTGNNTYRLQFEIKLNNLSNIRVQGFPALTLLVNGEESKANFSSTAESPCNAIEANSSCTLIYDAETSLDIAIIEDIQLVEVKYVLINR